MNRKITREEIRTALAEFEAGGGAIRRISEEEVARAGRAARKKASAREKAGWREVQRRHKGIEE